MRLKSRRFTRYHVRYLLLQNFYYLKDVYLYEFCLGLCRDYTPGQEKLMEGNGIDILMRALKSPVEKLQLKCCFLFAAICGSNSRLKDQLTDKKLVEDLIELYRKPESTIQEQVLSAINVLVDENPKAVKQAIEMKDVDFKTILRNRIEATSDDPRFSEECDMAKSLLDKFFKN